MNPELGYAPEEVGEAEKPEVIIRDVESFETEMGSIYRYDDEGRTSRYKTETGEQYPVQDLTVFVDVPEGEIEQDFLESIQRYNRSSKVYVLERQPDDSAKFIHAPTDIKNPEALYLVLLGSDGKFHRLVKATLRPTIGFKTYDTRRFTKDGEEMAERHLGNRVTKITPREGL